ncbi:MAG TPA: LysR family transcriptional regulator [Polyangiaceae bacterium]|nr:LysR family transcriptional regulator [Polyangiaceae bacterium]
MDIPWDGAQLFLTVAEAGSLSAAARKLGMTQPTMSRKLAELESTLGEPLFERDRSGVALTDFGLRLLEPARQMAKWAAELSNTVERGSERHGVVKITVPPGIGHMLLTPWAARLRAEVPDVDLQVLSTVRPLDMIRREADIALRLDGVANADCVASIDLRLFAYAAESYAATRPQVTTPAELDWIGWAPPLDDLSPNNILQRLVPDLRLAFASDDYLLQLRACELGLGAMLLPAPHPAFAPALPLRKVNLSVPPIRRKLSLLVPRSTRAIPRVKRLLEPLVQALEEWQAAAPVDP